MSQSNQPGVPGIGTMTDTLEFVKNMWGGMKIPGMVMPTLSVDDINKQITDLKAVEAWLTLNMNMLRSTIQALEIQSATIATLQSMSATMGAMGKAGAEAAPGAASPFSFSMPTAAKPAAPSAGFQSAPATEPGAGLAGQAAIPFADPAIWWNMLQDQFKQAVNSAIAPASPDSQPAAEPTEAAAPRKRKPAKP